MNAKIHRISLCLGGDPPRGCIRATLYRDPLEAARAVGELQRFRLSPAEDGVDGGARLYTYTLTSEGVRRHAEVRAVFGRAAWPGLERVFSGPVNSYEARLSAGDHELLISVTQAPLATG